MVDDIEKVGWRLNVWCRMVGINENLFYRLTPDIAPPSAKVGRARIVIESPQDWLQRVARQQAEARDGR